MSIEIILQQLDKFKDRVRNHFFPMLVFKARFIANYSSCTTTELSKLLASCLTAVKNMLSSTVKRYMRDLVKSSLV